MWFRAFWFVIHRWRSELAPYVVRPAKEQKWNYFKFLSLKHLDTIPVWEIKQMRMLLQKVKKFQDKIKKKIFICEDDETIFKHFTSSVSIEFSEFSGASSTPPHSLILFIHFLLPFSSNLGFFKCISLLQDSKPLKLKYWCVTWFCSNWKKSDPMNQNTASALDIKYKDKTCQRCWRPMRDVS